MSRPSKFVPLYVVQGRYESGWEDLCASLDRAEARTDLRAYRVNAPGTEYRVITRRTLRDGAK